MMGRQAAPEQLFYRFRVEDHVPAKHLLRKIDRLLDFGSLRSEFARLYSHTGRPSIDPELMIRIILVGYLYGILSERRLVEEVRLNLAYRWFCRLGLENSVPDGSTFSKNRHGRFTDGDILRRVFEVLAARCMAANLVVGTGAAVDGSTIAADANRDRRAPPEEIQGVWDAKDTVLRPVQAYLDQLAADDAAAPKPSPKHKPPKAISETDPQAAWSLKVRPGRFSYETNYLIGDAHGIIVDVEPTPARLSQEIVVAKKMLDRSSLSYAPKTRQ
jgi:transposase